MQTIWQDLRYGMRMLAKTPGFTVVAVLSLALGIGANTTVFSLMDAVMLRSLPIQDPDQIVEVATGEPGGSPHTDFSYPLYAALRDNNQALSGLVAYSNTNFGLAAGDQTERIRESLSARTTFPCLERNRPSDPHLPPRMKHPARHAPQKARDVSAIANFGLRI